MADRLKELQAKLDRLRSGHSQIGDGREQMTPAQKAKCKKLVPLFRKVIQSRAIQGDRFGLNPILSPDGKTTTYEFLGPNGAAFFVCENPTGQIRMATHPEDGKTIWIRNGLDLRHLGQLPISTFFSDSLKEECGFAMRKPVHSLFRVGQPTTWHFQEGGPILKPGYRGFTDSIDKMEEERALQIAMHTAFGFPGKAIMRTLVRVLCKHLDRDVCRIMAKAGVGTMPMGVYNTICRQKEEALKYEATPGLLAVWISSMYRSGAMGDYEYPRGVRGKFNRECPGPMEIWESKVGHLHPTSQKWLMKLSGPRMRVLIKMNEYDCAFHLRAAEVTAGTPFRASCMRIGVHMSAYEKMEGDMNPAKQAFLVAFLREAKKKRGIRNWIDQEVELVKDYARQDNLVLDRNQLRAPWSWWVKKSEQWHEEMAERARRRREEQDRDPENLRAQQQPAWMPDAAIAQQRDLKKWDLICPEVKQGKFLAKAMDSWSALQVEGNRMGHCVGSYWDSCVTGRSLIFHLSRGKYESTLELCQNDGVWSVNQNRGEGNKQVKQLDDFAWYVALEVNKVLIAREEEEMKARQQGAAQPQLQIAG